MWKREKTHQKICWILFFSYLLMLTYFMFFSDGFGRSEYTEYHYNLTLFKEIRRFYTYRELVGTKAFLLNIVGNVVCFMPFGFILPIITRLGERWLNTLLLSFLLPLSIETIQLVFRVGSFDVDDMFLNTVGGAAGYVSVTMLKWIRRAFHGSKNEKDFIH